MGLLYDLKGIYITCVTGKRTLVQSNREAQQQRTAQGQPSQASRLPQFQADTARSGNRKRSAVAWPGAATSSQDDQGTSDTETLDHKQEQQEQQQQQLQGVRGQRVHPPTPASYGPAEQAEAKRQANKEAALTWLDKAKAAAASKDWNAAVSAFLQILQSSLPRCSPNWDDCAASRCAWPDLLHLRTKYPSAFIHPMQQCLLLRFSSADWVLSLHFCIAVIKQSSCACITCIARNALVSLGFLLGTVHQPCSLPVTTDRLQLLLTCTVWTHTHHLLSHHEHTCMLTLQVQKAQRGLSLDLDADWASEAHSLIQSWQAAETKQAGGAGSSNPADKQAGSSKPHAQGRQGQQKQQQQQQTTKKQNKKQKQQSQQQQQQPKQEQPKQQEQEQPSTSRPQESFKAAGGSADAGSGSGSAPHGQYSYMYGPQGQRAQSAAPQSNDPSAAHHEWLSAGMLTRCMAPYDGQNEFRIMVLCTYPVHT